MIVQYLRGNLTSSAVALHVICRFLSNFGEGVQEDDLRRSLQSLRASAEDSTDATPVLDATLNVGHGLGMIQKGASENHWQLQHDLVLDLFSGRNEWEQFRSYLLRAVAVDALRAVAANEAPPDLAIAMTWFMQLDPRTPIDRQWSPAVESLVRAGTSEAVANSTQWNSFQRWLLALGLARRSDVGKAKVITPDPSTAVADQLPHLPPTASAREWLMGLHERLPVLGAPPLLERLPIERGDARSVPLGLQLGLMKLELAGVLLLEPSDDSSAVVTLDLESQSRQVGRITVTERR